MNLCILSIIVVIFFVCFFSWYCYYCFVFGEFWLGIVFDVNGFIVILLFCVYLLYCVCVFGCFLFFMGGVVDYCRIMLLCMRNYWFCFIFFEKYWRNLWRWFWIDLCWDFYWNFWMWWYLFEIKLIKRLWVVECGWWWLILKFSFLKIMR